MQVVVMMGQHLRGAVTVPPGHQPIAVLFVGIQRDLEHGRRNAKTHR